MDVETIDRNYEQLQEQGQQTVRALSALAAKLQRAVEAGDPNAREWLLDLKEVALEVRTEQTQVSQLLQSLHDYVANHVQDEARYDRPPAAAGYQSQQPYPYPPQQPYPPQYRQQQYQDQYQQQGYGPGGGAVSRFMNSGFGQAIAMGAGFEIGEDLIDDIFG